VCEFLLTSFLTLFHLHIFSLAEEISNNSPVAVRSCLASLKVQQEAGMPEALNREALNQSICYARKDWPEGLDGELFSSLEYCNSHHHISTSDPPSFYSPSSPCSCESQALSQIQALLLGIRPSKLNTIEFLPEEIFLTSRNCSSNLLLVLYRRLDKTLLLSPILQEVRL